MAFQLPGAVSIPVTNLRELDTNGQLPQGFELFSLSSVQQTSCTLLVISTSH